MSDLPGPVPEQEDLDAVEILTVKALGTHSEGALNCEVNLVGYFSLAMRQQVILSNSIESRGWRTTLAAVGGVRFPDCLHSRKGQLVFPRLPGGFLAFVSHPWSGFVEINTDRGPVRVDLYNEFPKTIMLDVSDGRVHDFDPVEIAELKSSFVDAASDSRFIDQREATTRPLAAPIAVLPLTPLVEQPLGRHHLGLVVIRALGQRADRSSDDLVAIVELEPAVDMFLDLRRIALDADWTLKTIKDVDRWEQLSIISRRGELRLNCAQSGSIAFLCWPSGGIVELETFGKCRRYDLYSSDFALLRVQFDSPLTDARTADAARPSSEARRRDFYASKLAHIDPTLPTGLYVPRWKGVAASTRNLFAQTLAFPEGVDGHPSDVTPDDKKYFSGVLLGSGCKHFVVSGGDLFWIDVIRRVQREDPRIRFDLIWHSNYLQMGEAHDWNLLKNWLRAVTDGLVTKMAVVKSGLELLLSRLGVEAIFIPNVIDADPADIKFAGAHSDVGIWLSGSSSYRKVPFAPLLALKSVPGSRLVGAGFDDESLAMVTELRIARGEIWKQPLAQQALHRSIQKTGLTLYVTLSECSPMLPLESLHLGVPCLVGANSHLFRSDAYLRRMLVVESPLSPECISRQARAALMEGPAIIDAFSEYSRVEQAFATAALQQLLA